MKNKIIGAIASALLAGTMAFGAQAGGITDDEIVLGTNIDLSGPIAQLGKEYVNGLRMALDEINEAGGVNGRQIRVVVEDNGYEPRRAVLAAQKLVTQDEVFAVIGTMGTATNLAALPILLENGVFNFMPQGSSSTLYDPPDKLKVAFAPSYFDVATAMLGWAVENEGIKSICVLYQDDDLGREGLGGVEAFSKARSIPILEQTSYKRGATDFSSQMARLKASDCSFVYSAVAMRDFPASISEARKIGFNPVFMGTTATYGLQVPQLGGEAVEGVYAAAIMSIPYLDSPNKATAEWANKFNEKFGEAPGMYSMFGYYSMRLFGNLAKAAGRDLTAESFNAAMEAADIPSDEFGNPAFKITADDRLSNRQVSMTKVENGKWVTVSGLLSPLPREAE